MNASEAQNCTNVQVRRCDDQSTVDDEKAQSVTQYYTVGGNIDLNNTVHEPAQSAEVTELGQTEVTSTGEAGTASTDISDDEQFITLFVFQSYSISLWSVRVYLIQLPL